MRQTVIKTIVIFVVTVVVLTFVLTLQGCYQVHRPDVKYDCDTCTTKSLPLNTDDTDDTDTNPTLCEDGYGQFTVKIEGEYVLDLYGMPSITDNLMTIYTESKDLITIDLNDGWTVLKLYDHSIPEQYRKDHDGYVTVREGAFGGTLGDVVVKGYFEVAE